MRSNNIVENSPGRRRQAEDLSSLKRNNTIIKIILIIVIIIITNLMALTKDYKIMKLPIGVDVFKTIF